MAKIFIKPNDYEKWLTSGVSQVNWPKECRRYHINLLKFKAKHPEAADMTPEQLDEYRAKLRAEASDKRQAAINAKLEAMTPEEREAYQKKKGSFYQKMTPEEKAAHNEVLRKRSQNFWDGMTAEEKAEFGKYRESKWTEEQKAERLQRWQEGSQRWREEHPEEHKAISTMGHAVYMKKFNSDPEFRERQIALLRKHNEEFFNAMSREEREEFYKKVAAALSIAQKKRFAEDPEYRKRTIQRLYEHRRDFVDGLSEKELIEHMKKMTGAAMEKMNDPQLRTILITNNRFNQLFEKRFAESSLSSSYAYTKELFTLHADEAKYWDYAIFRKSDGALVAVVDLDGSFFHGMAQSDYSEFSSERRDEQRGYFSPKGTKIYIIDEKLFDQQFEEFEKTVGMSLSEYHRYLFTRYRSITFPVPAYDVTQITCSYRDLFSYTPSEVLSEKRYGERMLYHFNSSIWSMKMESISPKEAWENDAVLRRLIDDGELYRTILNPNRVLQPMTVSSIAPRVDIIPLTSIKYLILKYLTNARSIYDPNGNLVDIPIAAAASMKAYTGYFADNVQFKEFQRMSRFFITRGLQGLCPISVNRRPSEFDAIVSNLIYSGNSDDMISDAIRMYPGKQMMFIVKSTAKFTTSVVAEIPIKHHTRFTKYKVILI